MTEEFHRVYAETQARRKQGQRVLVERTASALLDKNIKTCFGHERGLAIIRWLQIGGTKPALDGEECKAWLLSDECARDIGQGIDFSAYADEQEQCIHALRDRYSELVQRL